MLLIVQLSYTAKRARFANNGAKSMGLGVFDGREDAGNSGVGFAEISIVCQRQGDFVLGTIPFDRVCQMLPW